MISKHNRMIEALTLFACAVADGDSLKCGSERVRLPGIDAPEIGNCPLRRVWTPGDVLAWKLALENAIAGKCITLQRVGRDRYRRPQS